MLSLDSCSHSLLASRLAGGKKREPGHRVDLGHSREYWKMTQVFWSRPRDYGLPHFHLPRLLMIRNDFHSHKPSKRTSTSCSLQKLWGRSSDVRGQLNVSLLIRRSMGLSLNLPPSSLVVTMFIATAVFQATTPNSLYGLIAQSEKNITWLVSSRLHTTSYRGGSAGWDG